MSNTKFSICNAALVVVGGNTIDSFEDEIREAEVAGVLYPLILDDLLTRGNWNFAVKQDSLNRLTDEPLFGFKYAYMLPPDYLEVITMESFMPYDILENGLYTDAEEVNLKYKYRAHESKFSPGFVRLLVNELIAEFAIALGEDASKSKLYEGRSAKAEVKARHTNTKQKTTQAPRGDNFSLVTVRQC